MHDFDSLHFERELAGGVALYSALGAIPTHHRKRYETRDVSLLKRVYVHHSGAFGPAGLRGAQASARYCVHERGWPGAAYHFWIPAKKMRDELGRLCVLRLNLDETRCYHTGGDANGHGVGVVLQGNTTAATLTPSHVECLEALLPWLRARHGLVDEWLSWHSEASRYGGNQKPSCPGKHAQEWLTAYRALAQARGVA